MQCQCIRELIALVTADTHSITAAHCSVVFPWLWRTPSRTAMSKSKYPFSLLCMQFQKCYKVKSPDAELYAVKIQQCKVKGQVHRVHIQSTDAMVRVSMLRKGESAFTSQCVSYTCRYYLAMFANGSFSQKRKGFFCLHFYFYFYELNSQVHSISI